MDHAVHMHNFGLALKRERTARGWTADEASKRSKISPKTWQRLEDGLPVRALTVAKIDELLGLPEGSSVDLYYKVTTTLEDELSLNPRSFGPLKKWAEKKREEILGVESSSNTRTETSDTFDEMTRMHALLRDVHDSLQPYMDKLDSTQSVLDEVRIGTEVLARLAEDETLPSSVERALSDLRKTVARYSRLTMNKGAWLDLTRELVRLDGEIDSITPNDRHKVLVIFDPDVDERTIPKIFDMHLDAVFSAGGSLEKMDVWGLRRLAFEIMGRAKGVYVELTLNVKRGAVAEFTRALSDDERVLRSKVTAANRSRTVKPVSTFHEDERNSYPVMSPRESIEDGERRETTK